MNPCNSGVDPKWVRTVPKDRQPVYKDTAFFKLELGLDEKQVQEASSYKPKEGDVFIVTYPKNGTTWMQQIVYLIQHDAIPPETFEDLWANSVFFEQAGLEAVQAIKPPGSIKIHLSANFAPFSDSAKYIVVVRNPKDTLVSYYHHHIGFDKFYSFKGEFNDFFDLFLGGQLEFGDYYYFIHSWLAKKHLPNVLFISYEYMKANQVDSIRRIAYFLDEKYGKRVDDDEKYLQNILHHSSVSEMKSRYPSTLHFGTSNGYTLIRKGLINSWKGLFTEEQSKLISARFKEEAEKNPLLMTLWQDFSWLDDHDVHNK